MIINKIKIIMKLNTFLKKNTLYIYTLLLVIIIILLYIILKNNLNNKTTEGFQDNEDNYFSLDTIKKISEVNIPTPTKTQNNLLSGMILPYYKSNDVKLSKDEIKELINNNFLPCDAGLCFFNEDYYNTLIANTNKNLVTVNNIVLGDINVLLFKTNNMITKRELELKSSDGNINVKIPDLRKHFIAGAGPEKKIYNTNNYESDKYVCGDVKGEDKHQLTIEEMPSHNHLPKGSQGFRSLTCNVDRQSGNSRDPCHNKHEKPLMQGNDVPHENRPPFIAMHYIIYCGELNNDLKSTLKKMVDSPFKS
jgi:microcystin-dependent protein